MFNGANNGFHILLDAEAYDYSIARESGEGFSMSILYHLDIPIMKQVSYPNLFFWLIFLQLVLWFFSQVLRSKLASQFRLVSLLSCWTPQMGAKEDSSQMIGSVILKMKYSCAISPLTMVTGNWQKVKFRKELEVIPFLDMRCPIVCLRQLSNKLRKFASVHL